jgi:sulfur-oxidizing protein SoxY
VREGKVVLDIAELIDNGNAVPVRISVASPMTAADHVAAIALFNERNPQREVITVRLGPRAGRAEVATRIRLATSQKLVAVARLSDGSCWARTVEVIVTLAACIESED